MDTSSSEDRRISFFLVRGSLARDSQDNIYFINHRQRFYNMVSCIFETAAPSLDFLVASS
jgi:hypothetical protein